MLELGRRYWQNLTRRERIKVVLLVSSVIVMAGLEVLSVGSIMPFLTIAGNPEAVRETPVLGAVFERLGFQSERTFLMVLGLAVFGLVVLSSTWLAVTTWVQTRFVWSWNHTRSTLLLRRYLHRPFSYFLSRNSADLSNNILSEVQQVSSQLLLPAIQGLGRAIAAIGIGLALFLAEPLLALLVTAVLAGSYGLIFAFVQRKLKRIGTERLDANRERFTVAAEALSGIKDVKLLGREDNFVRRFQKSSARFSRNRAAGAVISQLPRFGVEAVAFGSIILLVVYLILQRGDLASVVPLLGFYAFAGYRLMPALQQTFKGFTQLRFYGPSLENLLDELEEAADEDASTKVAAFEDDSAPLALRRELRLRNVGFRYPSAEHSAIDQLDLVIPANTTVGLVGSTGSGKTTLADIALGLIRPQSGTIEVDGTPVSDEILSNWQRSLGYVPQNIFLMDLTVAENIAFGLSSREIDMDAVHEAAKVAMIDDFVRSELPDGYQTIVGERGVRLSGGQRQRIGIARALYHKPSVLVFDEATSSLDNRTEESVMDAIRSLQGRKTIIMIAHRLSTLRDCDKIYMLEHGELVSSGNYRELVAGRGRFAELARAGD